VRRQRAGNHAMSIRTAEILFYALWALVLIVAFVLQAIPIVLVVILFSLAVGVPIGAALTVVPFLFLGALIVSCVIASKLTKRRVDAAPARRPDPAHGLPRGITSPSRHYRDFSRLN
jgi:hypothetical protein